MVRRSSRRAAWQTARVVAVVAVVGFAARALAARWDAVRVVLVAADLRWVVVAVVLTAAGSLLTATAWGCLLRTGTTSPPPAAAARAFLGGQPAKYVPGLPWALAAQARLLRGAGVPARDAVIAGVVVQVHMLVAATLLAAPAVFISGVLLPAPFVQGRPFAVAAAAVTASAAAVAAAGMLRRRSPGLRHGFRSRSAAALYTAAVFSSVVGFAAGFAAAAAAVSASVAAADVVVLAAGFAAAYVVGVVAVFAPAGVGVRDLAVVALTAPFVGPAPAAAAALISRFAGVVVDLALAAAALVVQRR